MFECLHAKPKPSIRDRPGGQDDGLHLFSMLTEIIANNNARWNGIDFESVGGKGKDKRHNIADMREMESFSASGNLSGSFVHSIS